MLVSEQRMKGRAQTLMRVSPELRGGAEGESGSVFPGFAPDTTVPFESYTKMRLCNTRVPFFKYYNSKRNSSGLELPSRIISS